MTKSNGRFEKGAVPHNKKPPEYKACIGCNKSFLKQTKNPGTRYCSRECGWVTRRGRANTAEHNQNIKKNHAKYWLGKKQDPEHIAKATAKLAPYQSGEKHWNWHGGMTAINKRLRCSAKYSEWRTAVFERDNYTCVFCGQKGGRLQADHIIMFAILVRNKSWDELYDINNGRTLCEDCHRKTPTYCRKLPKCV